jgi:hypothetical protein
MISSIDSGWPGSVVNTCDSSGPRFSGPDEGRGLGNTKADGRFIGKECAGCDHIKR